MPERMGDTLRVKFAEEEAEFGGEEIGTGTCPLCELFATQSAFEIILVV